MRNNSAPATADLYAKLAATPPSSGYQPANRGTLTASPETVDEDRANDGNTGLPLR